MRWMNARLKHLKSLFTNFLCSTQWCRTVFSAAAGGGGDGGGSVVAVFSATAIHNSFCTNSNGMYPIYRLGVSYFSYKIWITPAARKEEKAKTSAEYEVISWVCGQTCNVFIAQYVCHATYDSHTKMNYLISRLVSMARFALKNCPLFSICCISFYISFHLVFMMSHSHNFHLHFHFIINANKSRANAFAGPSIHQCSSPPIWPQYIYISISHGRRRRRRCYHSCATAIFAYIICATKCTIKSDQFLVTLDYGM